MVMSLRILVWMENSEIFETHKKVKVTEYPLTLNTPIV